MNSGHQRPVLLVALGGNALVRKGQEGSIEEQLGNLKTPLDQIAELSREYRIIITHGNGPQVGNLLLQQECCRDIPPMPLEILVAQTQGQIGYMIESTLDTVFMEKGIVEQNIVSLISYVVVDGSDPAFDTPSKPIGPVLTSEQAAERTYPVRETAKGLRRVVASPRPKTIVEKREIEKLLDMDFIVICCGGGGIPVVRHGRAFQGVDAVIDKDLASSRLALEVGIDTLVLATDVAGVFLDYGLPEQRLLSSMTVDEAKGYLKQGHFPPGSMGPKVEACLEFMKQGGTRAVIAPVNKILEAVQGRTGTDFQPSK